MKRQLLVTYLVLAILVCWASSAWALSIGSDSIIDLGRTVVIPEDGSGGVAPANAIQFNTGFTLTAFFGHVAFYIRIVIGVFAR